jgi:hypothetical protein
MSLIGVGKATAKEDYALKMAKRADDARKAVSALAKLLPNASELQQIADIANAAQLKLNNGPDLTAAAEKVSALGIKMSAGYDGSAFDAIDKYLPTADKYKGPVAN